MKLYKYRDFSKPEDKDFRQLTEVLCQKAFWCARPSTLNDPDEFCWDCDYRPSDETVPLLTELLIQFRGRIRAEAHVMAAAAVSSGHLECLAAPIFKEMIDQCRNEIGLACFGSSDDNTVMWQRYGGGGAGICIEVEVPPQLLNIELFPVKYLPTKLLHIDHLLKASLNPPERPQQQFVYEMALLSKSPNWATEAEYRFISKRQSVLMHILGSSISRIILGPNLAPETRRRIQNIIDSMSYRFPM